MKNFIGDLSETEIKKMDMDIENRHNEMNVTNTSCDTSQKNSSAITSRIPEKNEKINFIIGGTEWKIEDTTGNLRNYHIKIDNENVVSYNDIIYNPDNNVLLVIAKDEERKPCVIKLCKLENSDINITAVCIKTPITPIIQEESGLNF